MSRPSLPVCVFFYNRPELVESCLGALERSIGELSVDVHIFIDGAKDKSDDLNVSRVRDKVKSFNFKNFNNNNIYVSSTNKGLANSIIAGISSVLAKYEMVVVVEDDLVVSTNFLSFMKCSLEKYQNSPHVGSISGFSFPIYNCSESDAYFHPRPTSWGWGTWTDRWSKVNWLVDAEYLNNIRYSPKTFNSLGSDMNRMLEAYLNKRADSWAIRWALAHNINNWLAVTPYLSKVRNDGFGLENATNTKATNNFYIRFDDTGYKGPYKYPQNDTVVNSEKLSVNIYNSNPARIFQKVFPNLVWINICKTLYLFSYILIKCSKKIN